MEKIHKIGRVYKITSPHTDKVYIGSTTQKLKYRFAGHCLHYALFLEGKKNFVTSFDIIKLGDAKIECLEEYEDITREQLEKYEGNFIKATNNVVNKGKTINVKENPNHYQALYRQNNDTELKKKQAIFRKQNKDIINMKHQCDCGGKYTTAHKAKHLKTARHQKFLEQQ